MPDRSLGQAAYEAYWAASGAPDAKVRQVWAGLPARIRAAWEAAATAVLEECGGRAS